MLLFIVEERFMLTGMGLLLTPGLGENFVKVGTKIKLIRPDKSVIEAFVKITAFNNYQSIGVGNQLTKDDVPVGTEVWLAE
ncbi:hypothetical protein ACI6Q2_18665 [Chitinophagaceae bacterium LWZ2-11]